MSVKESGEEMADKFLVIDGSSLIHRAFFALPPLMTKQGVHTGAVYGLSLIHILLTDSYGKLIGAPGGHPDAAAGAEVTIVALPLLRGRLPMLLEKVQTVVTVSYTHLIPDHKTGIQLILESIVQENYGVIASLEEIECIGHRVVHGLSLIHI